MRVAIENQKSKEPHPFAFIAVVIVLIASLPAGCVQSVAPSLSAAAVAGARGMVTVSGMRFLDGAGTPLLLHGINIINKSKAEGYTTGIERSDFAAMHSWGMNCVRLGILWDGLEPQPGKIDEQYLDRIARIVDWAKGEGIYVLLDMHQDLFSVKFSDGAPAWATLDDGNPYTPTTVWSDAYYDSEAVQAALDHFWANSPGPDGVGLQDHYARVWQRVAERFRDEPAVIGYDLMNEPFPGLDAARTRHAALARVVDLLTARLGEKAPSLAQFLGIAGTPDGRKQLTEWLGDMELFKAMLDASAPIMQEFERKRLMPMYTRVRRSIRQADSRHIIFIEPVTSANLGVLSVLTPLMDEDGHRDSQQAYAPHGYDIVTDTTMLNLTSNARIELIFSRHRKAALRLGMPMLVGEWGAFYQNPAALEAARFVMRQLDALQCGDTYWAYRRSLAQSPLLKALERHPAEAKHDRTINADVRDQPKT